MRLETQLPSDFTQSVTLIGIERRDIQIILGRTGDAGLSFQQLANLSFQTPQKVIIGAGASNLADLVLPWTEVLGHDRSKTEHFLLMRHIARRLVLDDPVGATEQPAIDFMDVEHVDGRLHRLNGQGERGQGFSLTIPHDSTIHGGVRRVEIQCLMIPLDPHRRTTADKAYRYTGRP